MDCLKIRYSGSKEELLRITNTDPNFTIRGIDIIIHALYYEERTLDQHVRHQLCVLELVKGIEKDLFNDPRVRYPYDRPALSGPTGTMSNVLTSYFFTMYAEMMKIPGMMVNTSYDLLQCYYLACFFQFDDRGAVVMPKQDFESFCDIVTELSRSGGPAIFSPASISEFEARTNDVKQIVNLFSKEDLPGRFTDDLRGVKVGWCLTTPDKKSPIKEWKDTPIIKFLLDYRGEESRYGPYNYNPCYIHDYHEIPAFHNTTLDELVTHVRNVSGLLTGLRSFPHTDPSSCDLVKRYGGRRRATRTKRRVARRRNPRASRKNAPRHKASPF
jgi:hypothetical protein